MTDMEPGIWPQLSAAQLLCVDDDPATLQVRKLLLESSGYSVRTATSGAEALDAMTEGADVRLVILDYLMPGMNGDELAKRLRKEYPALPLLAMSAVGQLPESLLQSVNAHLQKGEDPEVLLSMIAELLQGTQSAPTTSSSSRERKTILCVEDEELQLKLRRLLFENAGYDVLDVGSAVAALDIFRSQPVHAVVMDYSLHGQDGISVAAEMKKMRPAVPIVMLSGLPQPESENNGIDCWLRKVDVEPEDLVKKVEMLIENCEQIPHQPSTPE